MKQFFRLTNGATIELERHTMLEHATTFVFGFYDLFYPLTQGRSMIALDIGTSLGDSTVVLDKCLGPNSKVIGFEPSQEIQLLLEKNLARNNCRCDIHHVAASDKEAMMNFTYAGENGGLIDVNLLPERGPCPVLYPVRCVNTTDYLREKYPEDVIRRIKFIKIDTEGWDFAVLKGLAPIIQQNKPTIVCEWWNAPHNNIRLFEAIEGLSYFPTNTKNEPVTKYDFNTDKRTQDLILRPYDTRVR